MIVIPVKVTDKIILEIISKLKNIKGVYGAFLFGSRYYRDNREDSDYDLALFTDLSFFELGDIELKLSEDLEIKLDIIDLWEVDIFLQQEILSSDNNLIYLKDGYEDNIEIYLDDIIHNIKFKMRGSILDG